jgi:hypothetical protein
MKHMFLNKHLFEDRIIREILKWLNNKPATQLEYSNGCWVQFMELIPIPIP